MFKYASKYFLSLKSLSNPFLNSTPHYNFSSQLTINQFSEYYGVTKKKIIDVLKMLDIQPTEDLNIDQDLNDLLVEELNLAHSTSTYVKSPVINYNFKKIPVVTIMGHVDHGKTTLLDSLRNSDMADHEYGKITQSIGAFNHAHHKNSITIIDTPGHAAFKNMREKGGKCTDIVILVLSAIEGVKNQTRECYEIASSYNDPIIFALNKIDIATQKNIDDAIGGLIAGGMCQEEELDNRVVKISALNKINLDALMDLVLKEYKIIYDKGNYCQHENHNTTCQIIEVQKSSFGNRISILVQYGVLKTSSYIVSGSFYSKIKKIEDEFGNSLEKLTPGQCGVLVGVKGDFDVNWLIMTAKDEKEAKLMAKNNSIEMTKKELKNTKMFKSVKPKRNFEIRQDFYRSGYITRQENQILSKIVAGKSCLGFFEQNTSYEVRNDYFKKHLNNYIKFLSENSKQEFSSFVNIDLKTARDLYNEFNVKFEDEVNAFDSPDFTLMIIAENKNIHDTMISEINRLEEIYELKFKFLDKGYGKVTTEMIDEAISSKIPLLTFNLEIPKIPVEKENKLIFRSYRMIDYFTKDMDNLMYDLKNYSTEDTELGSATILKKFKFGNEIFFGCHVYNDVFINKSHSDTKEKDMYYYKLKDAEGNIVEDRTYNIKKLLVDKEPVVQVKVDGECVIKIDHYDQIEIGGAIICYKKSNNKFISDIYSEIDNKYHIL